MIVQIFAVAIVTVAIGKCSGLTICPNIYTKSKKQKENQTVYYE